MGKALMIGCGGVASVPIHKAGKIIREMLLALSKK